MKPEAIVGKKVTGVIYRAVTDNVVGLLFEDGTAMTAERWHMREAEETRSLFRIGSEECR